MKWIVTLACLTCADSEPFDVLEARDEIACVIAVERVFEAALRQFPPGSVIQADCVAREDPVEDPGLLIYPQEGR